MIYTNQIQKAIQFAVKTHELDQKQKRKGKEVPYIVHTLSVGLILAGTGATEDVIVAGILHDSIEDSVATKKVTKEMIASIFGQSVSDEALRHIETFSNDSLLLKSADIIENTRELIADYEIEGEKTFKRFNAPKDRMLQNYLNVIEVIIKKWTQNPLLGDLQDIALQIKEKF
jgi:hypothetical protein